MSRGGENTAHRDNGYDGALPDTDGDRTTLRAYHHVCVIACIGLILSIGLFITILSSNMSELEQSFRHDMNARIVALEHKSEILEQFWEDVQAFYLASNEVDWIEFRSFSQSILKRSDLEFISWIPVTQEGQAPEDLFMVPTLGGQGHETRQFLLESPVISAAIEKARKKAENLQQRSGAIVVSEEFVPPGPGGDEKQRLAIIIPTWTRIPAGEEALMDSKRLEPDGFVVTFLNIKQFLKHTLIPEGAIDRNISVRLSVDKGSVFAPVYTYQSADEEALQPANRNGPELAAMFEVKRDIRMGPAIMRVMAWPSIAYISRSVTWVPWAVLFLGLLLTLFVAIIVYQQISRNREIQRLVREKAGELAYSERRMRAILNNTVDGIITIDDQGRIETYNPACERLFGYTRDEAVGQNVSLLMPSPHRDQHDGYISRYLETGEAKIIGIGREVEGMKKDASTFPMELSIGEVPRGHGRAFVGIIRDITARKQTERALKSSHAALDDFVYIVSHDLKEPIRGMRNYTDFLLEDYEDKLDQGGCEKLQMLGRLADRMEELIDTLLKYSRLGRTELAIKSTDMNVVVDKVLDLLAPMIEEKRAQITVHRPLPKITCDRARVGEVFRNLIVNAIKYNDSDVPEVEIGCTTHHEDRPDEEVFYVADNGIGIPPKFHGKIFRMFQRLHADHEYGGGTGSGLTIVQKVIERHGGNIWVESDGRGGATFFFTLGSA